MAEHSAIEWTDATWNPTTGCTKVSPACANCYIERTPPFRIRGRKFVKGHIPLEFHENRLDVPLKKREPTIYFVNSLSDLFHEDVPDEFLHRVYHTMETAHWHTFQVLTKRPERMRTYLDWRYGPVPASRGRLPSRHIWHGVSAENQRMAEERIPQLLRTLSSIRFISAEPLLSPVDLTNLSLGHRDSIHALNGWHDCGYWSGRRYLSKLDWVIVGGESGPNLRPTNPEWVRSIRDQCVAAGVPFFFKQWGGKTAKAGGRTLDGREWSEMPEGR
jgi:protein gp37